MDWYRRIRIALRLSFFLIAAGVLAWVCREGSSLALVGIVFVVYVAAATLWVRGQYQASVDAVQQGKDALRPWTFPFWMSGPAVGGGILLFLYGVWRDNGTALIVGALVAYLGAGYALMRFRLYKGDGARVRVIVGLSLLAVVTVLVVVGLLLLEESGLAVILVCAIGLAPIALGFLAEPAIRWLQQPGRGLAIAVAAGGGAVLFLLDTWIAVARVDTWWIAYGFVGLALLVVAIVSSTQADIAAVIAAVSLMGVTSMSEGKPGALEPEPTDKKVLVVLGDSYMSGEGADVFYREDGDENHCNRAPTAWAAMAGKTKRLFDSVAFLACSGARTYHVQHEDEPPPDGPAPRPQYNEPGTQLDQADALGLKPSLVVVSLGGNDAGFSTIGMMCLAPGDCSERAHLWEDNLPRVGNALGATYDQIRDEFPMTPVLVAGYPSPIRVANSRSCDDVALSEKDIAFVSGFVAKLNDTVEKMAKSKGFYFLDTEQALADAHLQLCDPQNNGRPGLNFIGLRSVGGIAEQRFNPGNWYHNSLHPNQRGHAAILQVFEQWRATHRNPPAYGPKEAAPPTEAEPPEPPCDLVKDSQSTRTACVDEAAAWARGQIRDTLLVPRLWGLQIALAAIAAWLFAVALFGWRKPWWPKPPE